MKTIMNSISLLIAAVFLIIHIGLCIKFNSIANDKGYYGMTYFWVCFFLGIAGMILVAALPNYTVAPSKIKKNDLSLSNETWTCKNCNTVNPTSKISCSSCGQYK